MLVTMVVDYGVHFSCVLQCLQQGGGCQGIKMSWVLPRLGCFFTRRELTLASRGGKRMPVRTSLLESESEVEEVTGTEPHESVTTDVPADNDTDSSDEGDKFGLATKPGNDLGLEVPPFEGGLTEDALLPLPVYIGVDDEEAVEDLSTLADVDFAPAVGVQGHRLRERAEPQFPIPRQQKGEPLLEATNKKDNSGLDVPKTSGD